MLPASVPLRDAVANLSRLPLLVQALVQGRFHYLRELTADRLHEPHRMPLYREFEALKAAGFAAGAAAVTLSGAGPTMLAIAPADHAADIVDGWSAAAREIGVQAVVRPLEPEAMGARTTIIKG
jgi:homoserine kinase